MIERVHPDAAQADLDDIPVLTSVLNTVAYLEGAVEHDGDAGDERSDQVAHREADRERQRSADDGERGGVEPDAEPDADDHHGQVDDEPRDRLDFLDRGPSVRELLAEAEREVLDDTEHDQRADEDRDRKDDSAPTNELGQPAQIRRILSVGIDSREKRDRSRSERDRDAHR